MAGGGSRDGKRRKTWLVEDEDVWGTRDGAPPVVARDDS